MDRPHRHRGPGGPDDHASTEEDLRRALARDELEVQFQPVVRTRDEVVVGVEALVRWRRPGGHLLSAEQFLGAADRAGLVHQVDHRAMAVVAGELVRTPVPAALQWISVNLAEASLRDDEVIDRIVALADELRRQDLELLIEIPEPVDDLGQDAAAELVWLRGAGIRVALDGFGTRRPPSRRMRELPVDVVKIDGSGLGRRGTGARRRTPEASSETNGFARGLVRLARSLGRSVAVKRVEAHPAAVPSLVAEADFVQGHLFGRPASLRDLT